MGPNTLFAIGSATKAFTATLAGMLVDEGRLGWDDRVVDRLPGFALPDPYPTAEITTRDLLAHRSGLPSANLMWLAANHPPDTLIRRLRRLEPADVALPHVRLEGTVRTVSYRDVEDVAPAGAMNSSAEDIARWLRFLLAEGAAPNGRPLIEAATLRETWTPQIVVRSGPVTRAFHPAARVQAYGLGWFVSDFYGRTLVAHGGGIDGMSALVAWVPEEDLGVAILTNLQTAAPAWIYGILYAVLDPSLGVGPTEWEAPYRDLERMFARFRASEPRRAEGSSPSRAREDYAGTYVAPILGAALVTTRDGALVFRYGTLEGVLEHWHHNVFRITWQDPAWRAVAGPGWITFRLDRSGAVEGLTLEALPGSVDWMSRTGDPAPPSLEP